VKSHVPGWHPQISIPTCGVESVGILVKVGFEVVGVLVDGVDTGESDGITVGSFDGVIDGSDEGTDDGIGTEMGQRPFGGSTTSAISPLMVNSPGSTTGKTEQLFVNAKDQVARIDSPTLFIP